MEEELKKKYMEFQMVEQQIKQLSEQVQELNNKVLELDYLKGALDEFKSVKEGEEILAPIGSGIFVKAKLSSHDLLVNVGTGAVINKDVEGTKGLLDGQANEIDLMRSEILEQLEKLSSHAMGIEQELKKMVGQDV